MIRCCEGVDYSNIENVYANYFLHKDLQFVSKWLKSTKTQYVQSLAYTTDGTHRQCYQIYAYLNDYHILLISFDFDCNCDNVSLY